MASALTSRLRDDLRILRLSPQQFVLRDPRTGTSFELGPEERFLTLQLDGTASAEDILRRFRERFGRPLTARYLAEFIEQLRSNGLLEAEPATPVVPPKVESLPSEARGGLNRGFDVLNLLGGWVFEPLWLLALLPLWVLGATILVRNFSQAQGQIRELLMAWTLPGLVVVWLTAVFLGLSLPVAAVRGMACRRFGGWVRSFSARLHRDLLPYWEADVGDSFLSMDSRGAWTVLGIGIVVRLTVGALAAVGWRLAPPGSVLSGVCLVLVMPACVSALLRLNPFVKFDVYGMLCYYFEETHLYERARAETTAWLTWNRAPEALPPEQRSWFRLYGLMAELFSWLANGLLAGLVLYVVVQSSSGPLALAALAAAVLWYREEIGSIVMSYSVLSWLVRGGGRWYIRWPLRLALLAVIIVCGFLPYHHEVGGDVRLLPLAEYGIRAQVAGEIAELQMREGELLESGSLVARLVDREQRAAVEAKEAELVEAQARLDLLKAGTREEKIKIASEERDLAQIRLEYFESELRRVQDLAATKTVSDATVDNALLDRDSAQKQLAAAQEQLRELKNGAREEEIRVAEAEVERIEVLLAQRRKELELTEIHVPNGGRLMTSHVEARVGTYVQPGDLIAVVKDSSVLRAEIAATQQAAVSIRPGQRVHIRLWGTDGELLVTRVKSIAPEAVDTADVSRQPIRSDRENLVQRSLADPERRYVRVFAEIENAGQQLLPEMTGKARIVVEDDRLWRALARPLLRFFRVEVWSWLP